MKKIEKTKLEYTEAEGVALDYFLGGRAETKEQWAQRVTVMCQEYSDTNGRGNNGKGMCGCYSRTPESLWKEQKEVRMKDFSKHSQIEPKTRATRDKEEKESRVAEHIREVDKVQKDVEKLRKKGFDDETIKIIYPKAAGVL